MDTLDKLVLLGKEDLIAFTESLYNELLKLSGLALPSYIEYILREVVAHYTSNSEVYCRTCPTYCEYCGKVLQCSVRDRWYEICS